MEQSSGLLEKCREYGLSRIEVSKEAKSQEDYIRLWKDPAHAYPFAWGDCWKGCIEFSVLDYALEVGFWLDIVGLDANVLTDSFAMIMTPDKQFMFSIVPAGEGGPTPPDALRIQFMLDGILKSTAELEERGVVFEKEAHPEQPGGTLYHAVIRTPNGIAVDMWGVEPQESPE